MRISAGAALLGFIVLILAQTALAQRVTLEVTSVTVQASAHDTPPKGKPNAGDRIAFRDMLLNRQPLFGRKKGKAVAHDVGTVTYTSAVDSTIDVIVTFEGIGTLHYHGPFVTRTDGTTVIPVTGGTGVFAGATGTVTIGKGTTRAPAVFDLSVPQKVDLTATAVA